MEEGSDSQEDLGSGWSGPVTEEKEEEGEELTGDSEGTT